MCALGQALLCFVYSFPLICLVLILIGVCTGIMDVCCNSLIIKEFDSPSEAEPYVHMLHASFAIGGATGPIFVTKLSLISSYGFTFPFLIISAAFLPVIILGIFIALRPPRLLTSESAESYASQNISKRLRFVAISLFSIVMGLYVGSEVCFGVYIYTYATEYLSWSPILSGTVNTLFWACFAVGRIGCIFLAILKAPAKWMVVFSVAGTCLFALVPIILTSQTTRNVALWIAAAGIGFAMAPLFPSLFNLCSSYFEVTGAVSSAFVCASATGEMFIPLLVGILFKYPTLGSFWALFPALLSASLLGLLTIGLALFLVRNVAKQTPLKANALATISYEGLAEEEESFADFDDL